MFSEVDDLLIGISDEQIQRMDRVLKKAEDGKYLLLSLLNGTPIDPSRLPAEKNHTMEFILSLLHLKFKVETERRLFPEEGEADEYFCLTVSNELKIETDLVNSMIFKETLSDLIRCQAGDNATDEKCNQLVYVFTKLAMKELKECGMLQSKVLKCSLN